MAGNIVHLATVRFQVVGIGGLDLAIESEDAIEARELATIEMETSNYKEPRVIANFMSQNMKLRGSTNKINEIMRVTSICFFVKPVWSEFPY